MQEFREREFPFLSFESKDPTNTASEKKKKISEGDKKIKKFSVAGTWTRVSRVRAEYPNQLDYNGMVLIGLKIP